MPPTGSYSRAALATRRFRNSPRAAWFGARASNVMQRPGRLALTAAIIFVAVLLAYLSLPAGARGVVNLFLPERSERRDTTSLKSREDSARASLSATDAALARNRIVTASIMASISPVGMSAEQVAARDSLATLADVLQTSIRRANGAPLPESFRSLAATSTLRDEPEVRALIDSLNDVERERDELGAGATVDPVFVALTTQANELGRRISTLAGAKLATLQRQIAQLEFPRVPTAADSAAAAVPDSLPLVAARGDAFIAFQSAERSLALARAANAVADSLAATERAQTQMAPIPVLVAGAGIVALVFAFALSLLDEMRSPRVADAAEAERLTDLRVLGVARSRAVPPERNRRAADRTMPARLDPTFDAYRVLAWHLSSQWPRDGIVTVTGDAPMVNATVAANLAAVMANDARVTLLIDADLEQDPVRAVFALPQSPGLVAVLENRRKWSEALVGVSVGRGRSMDVLPAGGRATPLGAAESQALVGELQRAARRHDATIVVTSLAGAKRFRAGDDVVVCATLTRTRLATLARMVASLIDDGARVRGVVLWEGAVPAPRQPSRPQSAGVAAA